jgi:hypothetical protein
MALYDLRNKRGVGHVGGDVDPNHMDAAAIAAMGDWLLGELVRMFHGVSTEHAEEVIEALVEKQIPVVWRVGERSRVLAAGLPYKDQTLILLYSAHPKPVKEADLLRDVEHSNASVYRRDVLKPLHKGRLLEYDPDRGVVTISPKGVRYVEESLLKAGGPQVRRRSE